MKNYKIQYIPTGHIFLLPKGECDRLILESEHNYIVLDKDYQKPTIEQPKAKSTVLESILEKNTDIKKTIKNSQSKGDKE